MKTTDLFSMMIFTIDDEEYNTLLIEELLLEAGFENIKKFKKSQQLFDTLDSGIIPDLILSDIMMPDMDGYQLCKKIKSNKSWNHIPIIMITAAQMANSEPLRLSFEAGAMDFIPKPINEIELIARVKSALIIEKQRKELIRALHEVTTLQGLLPICSYCKKIRDDHDYWSDIDEYVASHADVKFSHSCCPDCYENIVKPELMELKNKSNKK